MSAQIMTQTLQNHHSRCKIQHLLASIMC